LLRRRDSSRGIICSLGDNIEGGDKQMSIFPTKILLATDGSAEAQLAATTAADLHKSTDSELHVVYVGELRPTFLAQTEVEPAELEREAQRLLDEQVRTVEEAGGTVKEAHLRLGRADEEIVDLADSLGIGLIVMGSRGRGRLRRALMGSVSDSVVRHAHCPVTIVRE
jgi:nucleotide-binding universal stress UspA family protein